MLTRFVLYCVLLPAHLPVFTTLSSLFGRILPVLSSDCRSIGLHVLLRFPAGN